MVDLGLPPCLAGIASLPSLWKERAGVLLAFLMQSILLKSHLSSGQGLPCCASPRMRCSELKMRLSNSFQQWAEESRRVPVPGSRDSTAPPSPSPPLRSRTHSRLKHRMPANKLIKAALDMLTLSREQCHNVKAKYHLQSVS